MWLRLCSNLTETKLRRSHDLLFTLCYQYGCMDDSAFIDAFVVGAGLTAGHHLGNALSACVYVVLDNVAALADAQR